MKNLRTRLIGAGLFALALIGGYAVAQVPTTPGLTGNEIVRAALPGGGQDIAVPSSVFMGSISSLPVATGTTVATVMTTQYNLVFATGAITTWNITLPASPYNNERVLVACPGGNTTTLSIAAASTPSGTSIVGTNPTSCTASSGGASAFIYNTVANTWYRV